MKKVSKDKIVNIKGGDTFDNKFLFEFLDISNSLQNKDSNKYTISSWTQVFFISDLLEKRKNIGILDMINKKPAMYSNLYSPKDELEIFEELFDYSIKSKKKIHIIWITLKQELEILEKYYSELWFFREEINCFEVDFKFPLVSVSVKIENLLWKGSDYKKMWEKIFFNPPVRESGQTKAMFKWINRGLIAWIHIVSLNKDIEKFLQTQIISEHILPTTMSKVLNYNLSDIWFEWVKKEIVFSY